MDEGPTQYMNDLTFYIDIGVRTWPSQSVSSRTRSRGQAGRNRTVETEVVWCEEPGIYSQYADRDEDGEPECESPEELATTPGFIGRRMTFCSFEGAVTSEGKPFVKTYELPASITRGYFTAQEVIDHAMDYESEARASTRAVREHGVDGIDLHHVRFEGFEQAVVPEGQELMYGVIWGS